MKIIHIEDFFHPDAGYQINVLTKFQAVYKHDVTIITAEIKKIPGRLKDFFGASDIEIRDDDFTRETGVKIIRVPIYRYYSGRAIYPFKFFRQIKLLKPDILFIHGNDSYAGIIFTLFNKWLPFPVIMDNHMLEMATNNRYNKIFRWWYRTFISGILIKEKIKVLRVQNDNYIIKNLGIPKNLSPLIPLGTDTMHFHPNPERSKMLRAQNKMSKSDFVVLYIGKLTSDKGVGLLAEACRERFTTAKNVVLLVVGNVSTSYGQQVEAVFQESKNRVLRFPTQKYVNISDFYLLADVVVFPRHCSLSFFDAQACGLPVLLEKNSININRISSGNGIIFKSGDLEDLRLKIKEMADMPDDDYVKMQNAALNFIKREGHDYTVISEQYQREIIECVRNYKRKRDKRREIIL